MQCIKPPSQHEQKPIKILKSCIKNCFVVGYTLMTHSSSRCRCDSTMVMGQCGLGWGYQLVKRQLLCSCWVPLRRRIICVDPSNTGEDRLCTPMAADFYFYFFLLQNDSVSEQGMQESAPRSPPQGIRKVLSLQAGHQLKLHCICRGKKREDDFR